ncbi:MAG: hypothetical protein ACOYXM_08070 [Actinomycetota bacterium]
MRRAIALGCVAVLAACGGDEGSAEELCAAVRADRSTPAVFSGFDPTDTSRAVEQLREARVTLGELRDAAPSELRDDIDLEIAYVQALLERLEDLGGAEPESVVQAVREVTDAHPDVADAAARLDAWSDESCP